MLIFRSEMISQEDYIFVVALDNATADQKDSLLHDERHQCARTFLSLLGHISKDTTIQYLLVMIDDMLQVGLAKKYFIILERLNKVWETETRFRVNVENIE